MFANTKSKRLFNCEILGVRWNGMETGLIHLQNGLNRPKNNLDILSLLTMEPFGCLFKHSLHDIAQLVLITSDQLILIIVRPKTKQRAF